MRWEIYTAAVKRPMRLNLDWKPFFDVVKRDLPYRERLAAYARIARERLDAEPFAEFCATHLGHFDGVVWEFFATDKAKEAVRVKVEALFPAHEVEQFTELFWTRIQEWRQGHQPS